MNDVVDSIARTTKRKSEEGNFTLERSYWATDSPDDLNSNFSKKNVVALSVDSRSSYPSSFTVQTQLDFNSIQK